MIKNSRINVKNSSGTYDILHPETNENMILVEGGILKDKLNDVSTKLETISQTYYDSDITLKPYKHSNGTIYYLTRIPFNNKNKIKKSFANDVAHINDELPRLHAIRKNAILATNASGYYTNKTLMGVQIKDGVAYGEQAVGSKWYTLGVKTDGTLKAYSPDKNSQYLLNDGVENSFCFTIPIIENGLKVSTSLFDLQADAKTPANRQIIAQLPNKDYLILTTEGRTTSNIGLTLNECADLLLKEGVIFAYNIDGGGSTQTIFNGALINSPYDTNLGITERATGDILYFGYNSSSNKPSWYNDISKLSEKSTFDVLKKGVEDTKKNDFTNNVDISCNYPTLSLNETISGNGGILYKKNDASIKKINLKDESFSVYDFNLVKDILNVSNDGQLKTTKGILGDYFSTTSLLLTNMDDLNINGVYWVNPSTPNLGSAGTGVLLHIQLGSTNSNAIQINFRMNAGTQKRVCSSGVWGAWGVL